MLPRTLWLLCLAAISARSQDTVISLTGSFSTVTTNIPTLALTGSGVTYLSYTGQSTISSSSTGLSNATANAANATATTSSNSQITVSSNSPSLFVIGGGATSTSNTTNTASSTSSAALPSNTLPCNNYPEFCNRRYSNITEVCAHNSAFAIKNNAASNQQLPIINQLNDGVRMLQGETHYVNGTIYNCHTSCNLLNAGTWQSELETVVGWLRDNPYDVLTILIVNSDYTTVENYVPSIQNSGLAQYLYEPEYIPQHRDQWPTLGQMILSGKRVVMFMDYNANQTAVPYVLDEFTHMWETPFSPQNQSFPCTQQRPPGLSETDARDNYMYLANHNLNTAIDVSAILGTGSSDVILVPNTAEMNITNGDDIQFGRLGAMNQNCTNDWNRPPNFLLVDYYNIGSPSAGSVFQVAAEANGVTYNRPCCGTTSAAPSVRSSLLALVAAMGFALVLAL